MSNEWLAELENRVLMLAPTARDGAACRDLLAAEGVHCVVCATIDEVCREAGRGAGATVVTAEAILGDTEGRLTELIRTQPAWSDLPLIVLTPPGAESLRLLRVLEAVGPMTLMKRPAQVSTLVSAVRTALRDRRRQYEVRDLLTERQRAADSLSAEWERFRVTLASIGDAVIATDTDGRVTFLNRVAESLTGWAQEEAAGRPLETVFRIVSEDTRQPAENPVRRALRDERVVGLANHTQLISRDGTERAIDDSGAPIRDEAGRVTGVVLVFRDIGERKAAEEARARLAAIVEFSEDAIVSKSLEGIILSWNAGAERLFGYSSHEAIGQPITLIIPSERLGEEREFLERLRRGERVEHFETVRVTKNGRRIDISLTVSPVRDAEGRVVGASKVARDITERKRAEEALKEVDRRKNEFIALLAHELRNPLAPIRNGLQVIRLSHDRKVRERSLEVMDRQLGHMVRLIDDLLDVSRISQNKMELRRSRVLLADIVGSAVEAVRPLIETAGHELTVSLPSEPVYLDADLTRLAQVLSNLLTNSAKYTESGGKIWLTAKPSGGEVAVSVRDTGIGIPTASLPTIFDMFSQVDRSIERTTGGLGIGLALVKGLVEMHGGTVTVASGGTGRGSEFTVRLPVLTDEPEPFHHEPIDSGEQASGPSRRFLVVDDNRDSAESMAAMLNLLGNEVLTAHDGVEAVEAAGRFRPEVILMDVGMPRLNGYEATRYIREQAWGKEIIVVALTGWGQEGDRVQSREAGCDGHLVKPVSLSDLQRVLVGFDSARPCPG